MLLPKERIIKAGLLSIILLFLLSLLLSLNFPTNHPFTISQRVENVQEENSREAIHHRVVECKSAGRIALRPLEKLSLAVYRSQLGDRRRLIQLAIDNPPSHHAYVYYPLTPEVKCDGIARLDAINDSGKWLCNPHCIPRDATVYSLGINNVLFFDTAIHKLMNGQCKLRAVDKEEQNNDTQKAIAAMRGSLLIATVGSKADEEAGRGISLHGLMRHFGDDRIEILKVDIEGDEDKIIDEIVGLAEPPCQLLLELHFQTPSAKAQLLRKLSVNGYYLHSSEANMYSTEAREFSFIHESCLASYGVDVIYGKYLS